jgi:hypothetical protein
MGMPRHASAVSRDGAAELDDTAEAEMQARGASATIGQPVAIRCVG